MLVDFSGAGNDFEVSVDYLIGRNGKDSAVLFVLVVWLIFPDEFESRFEQRHGHTLQGLLAVVVQPHGAVNTY